MTNKIENKIAWCFYLLFFIVPLILYPKTSEIFEFNKIIVVYLSTIIITSLWLLRMIFEGKFIFTKTKIDIFLIIFFFSQLISTILSVDFRSSLLGYYSRFNGGLVSVVSFSLLYWAYVSNMDYIKTIKAIKVLLISAFLVSVWGIFEHFGKSFSCYIIPDFAVFDVSCWVQDVQNRVFASFGQPNWLAAFTVALTPLTWAFIITSQNIKLNYKKILWILLSIIFVVVLLYTKSRSGILAFAGAFITFWVSILIKKINIQKQSRKPNLLGSFIIIFFFTSVTVLLIGTPWTPSLGKLISNNKISDIPTQPKQIQGPVLEVGGTESGQIRKIVWKGALDIWKHNPLFGTGVETFAFSYYKYRPVEHNLVSEWNFLYNKAHNEYLNFAATTGTVGLLAYLLLIFRAIIQIVSKISPSENTKQNKYYENFNDQVSEISTFQSALLSGFVSILITNFFGFSVVGVSLLFYLFPAMAIALAVKTTKDKTILKESKLTSSQYLLITIIAIASLILLNNVRKYWLGDVLYAKGKSENDSGLYTQSRNTLLESLKYSPQESIIWDELADSTASIAYLYAENGDMDSAKQIAKVALTESDKVMSLSPASVILKKTRVKPLVKLSAIDPVYLNLAKQTLLDAQKLAPTDAHISYNLAVVYMKTGDIKSFKELILKTLDMKPNYKEARYALAQVYIYEKNDKAAENELQYIANYIDKNFDVQKALIDLKENQEI